MCLVTVHREKKKISIYSHVLFIILGKSVHFSNQQLLFKNDLHDSISSCQPTLYWISSLSIDTGVFVMLDNWIVQDVWFTSINFGLSSNTGSLATNFSLSVNVNFVLCNTYLSYIMVQHNWNFCIHLGNNDHSSYHIHSHTDRVHIFPDSWVHKIHFDILKTNR